MNFFKRLLDGQDELSSKRFISLTSLIVFFGVVICAIFGLNVSDTIIYSLITLILGNATLTLFTKKDENNTTNL